MAILLKESEVHDLFTMDIALDAMESLFKEQGKRLAGVRPRTRMQMPGGTQSLMAGWIGGSLNAYGLKVYGGPRTAGTPSTGMIVVLYDGSTGKLLAIIEGNQLGRIRTGAASGVATKYMAREDAATVGVIGTGGQARTQLEAVCKVRDIRHAWVYSRTPERREAFAREMAGQLQISVDAAPSAWDCVTYADIVVTITNAATPVFEGRWLGDGVHINAAGSNNPQHAEVDTQAIKYASIIAVDDIAQAKMECGELIAAAQEGAFHWDQAVELADVVAGNILGRYSEEDITLFESQGIGTEDVAAARVIYEAALKQGVGVELPL